MQHHPLRSSKCRPACRAIGVATSDVSRLWAVRSMEGFGHTVRLAPHILPMVRAVGWRSGRLNMLPHRDATT
jgi:hypothetical protein